MPGFSSPWDWPPAAPSRTLEEPNAPPQRSGPGASAPPAPAGSRWTRPGRRASAGNAGSGSRTPSAAPESGACRPDWAWGAGEAGRSRSGAGDLPATRLPGSGQVAAQGVLDRDDLRCLDVLATAVRDIGVTGTEVDRGHAELRESGHVGPAELGHRHAAHRVHEISYRGR